MGYNLHITRKETWFDEDSTDKIPLIEWKMYVASDTEMRLDNFAEAKTDDGQTVRFDNDGLSVWTKYSKNGVGGNQAWFAFLDGNIVVKNPDTEIRNKMIHIATMLKAKVQGDDGEVYESKESFDRGGPWWKVW